MAITKNLVVTLKNDTAKPKEKMFVYRDDVGIEMIIELKDFNYSIDAVENRNNIQKAYALFRTPANKTYRYTNIKISDGKLVFMFSQDIVNVMQEIGEYELQFQLYDKENNRLTIPSYNFYVKEPLTIDGELVDTAVVDESMIVDFGEEQEYIFVITDGYIKTNWKTGDLITKERLNKVEDALSVITDAVNSKAEISQLHNHENKEILDTISSNKINEWNNKSNFDGDYNSLINKPTIPAKVSDLLNDSGYLTEHQDISGKVDKVDGKSLISDDEIERLSTLKNYDDTNIYLQLNDIESEINELKEGNINLSNYVTKDELSEKADKSELHSHNNKSVLDGITSNKIIEWDNKSVFSGNYNDLTNKPTIPTKVSELTNDESYLTSIPDDYVTDSELNSKGYLTEHQDISNRVGFRVIGEGTTVPPINGGSSNDYVLPIATKTTLGGVKIGNNLLIDSNGVLSATAENYDDTEIRELINETNTSLDNKVSYFENINNMKTSNKIKVNTVCKTLGFYNTNDGGGATYRITNNTALNNGFSFSLNNGLTAELIYNDEINIRQLGARSFDENGNKVDIKPYINDYLSKSSAHENNGKNKQMLKLFIPTGRWFTSSHKIVASSIYIYGVNQYSYPYATGTIIAPITDNQEYLWLVGDDTTDLSGREYGNITLKSLMFTTYNFASNTGIPLGGKTADTCYSVEKMLGVYRVYGGHFENLYFTNYLGTALSIASSNESVFDDITLRNGDAMFKGNIVFDTDVVENKNISACFIDRISFEGVKGDLFVFKESSKYINNHIGTVLFEDRSCVISKDGDVRNYVVADDGNKEFSPMAVFRIEEQEQCELVVDNVLLNNFGRTIYTYDSNEYLFDTIVFEEGKVSKGLANIKTITNYGARRDTILYNKAPYEGLGSYNFIFVCENARHTDTDSYKFIIKSTGTMKPYIRYKDIGYERCIDYVTSPKTLLNKNGKVGYYMPVITDEESLLDEKLVINNFNYKKFFTSYNSEASCFIIPVTGNKLHIRVKTKKGFLAHCFVSDNSSEYQNKTINSTEEVYKWHTIDLTDFRATQTDKELKIAIRTLTADETNYVNLDVFYWE